MTRNEIWWAKLPAPAGRRPVLVLSRSSRVAARHRVVVAEITTHMRGSPTEVVVGRAEGLPRRSAVNLENLWTLLKDQLRERAGALGREKIRLVNEALCFALELPEPPR